MSKILEIGGVKLSTATSNSRYKRRDDSLIVVIDEGATISGKFTKNKFKASPIKIAEQHIKNRCKRETTDDDKKIRIQNKTKTRHRK